jgi:hypothetical protein
MVCDRWPCLTLFWLLDEHTKKKRIRAMAGRRVSDISGAACLLLLLLSSLLLLRLVPLGAASDGHNYIRFAGNEFTGAVFANGTVLGRRGLFKCRRWCAHFHVPVFARYMDAGECEFSCTIIQTLGTPHMLPFFSSTNAACWHYHKAHMPYPDYCATKTRMGHA